MGDGGWRIQELAAIGKGVGRDVHDAHDEGGAGKPEFKLAGAKVQGIPIQAITNDGVNDFLLKKGLDRREEILIMKIGAALFSRGVKPR